MRVMHSLLTQVCSAEQFIAYLKCSALHVIHVSNSLQWLRILLISGVQPFLIYGPPPGVKGIRGTPQVKRVANVK